MGKHDVQVMPFEVPKKGHGISLRHQRFCDEYLIDLHGARAAIRAGYKEKDAAITAARLLNHPNVVEYLRAKQETYADKLGLDYEWILQQFKVVAQRCMQAEPVMIPDGEGGWVESGEWKFDSSGANKALENIGKHLGFYEADNNQKQVVINVEIS